MNDKTSKLSIIRALQQESGANTTITAIIVKEIINMSYFVAFVVYLAGRRRCFYHKIPNN